MQQILLHTHSAIALLSFVLWIEILIKAKRPRSIKFNMLGIISMIFLLQLSYLYCALWGYNRWIIELPKTVITALSLNFLGLLFYHKIKRAIGSFCISIVLIHILFFLYAEYINHTTVNIHLKTIEEMNIFRPLTILVAGSTIVYILFTILKKMSQSDIKENFYFNQLKNWIQLVSYVIISIAIARITIIFLNFNSDVEEFQYATTCIFICFVFLLRPTFLNRTDLSATISKIFDKKNTILLSKDAFYTQFYNKTYYLNTETSIENFSHKLGITPDILSSYIFEEFGCTFTDLVNKSRIEYFIDLIKSEQYKDHTIESLSEKAGFGSRQNFNRYFKRFHGGNPSDLMKSIYGEK
jgi:AraC-like DNA-binding protein